MELIDYATNTPQNTNKTILKQLINNEKNKAVYESVEDLKKSGGVGYTNPGKAITWNGDTTGLEKIEYYPHSYAYKVSDDIIDVTKVDRVFEYGEELPISDWYADSYDNLGTIVSVISGYPIVLVYHDYDEVEKVSKGTYFTTNVNSVEIAETIYPIDPKFLPKGGAPVVLNMHLLGLSEQTLFSGNPIPLGAEELAIFQSVIENNSPLYLVFEDGNSAYGDWTNIYRLEYMFFGEGTYCFGGVNYIYGRKASENGYGGLKYMEVSVSDGVLHGEMRSIALA